jgi:CDP-diacylglycerol--glycerol-3-phosphate 3-phosphatidyltransferase
MQNNQAALTALRRRWWGVLLFYIATLWLGYQGLRLLWPETLVTQWAIQATVVLAYSLGACWTVLDQNRRPGESSLLPAFGPGNILTLSRGLVMALLAGFLFLPRPVDGLLAWTPAILYTLLASLDYLDGTVARVTNQVTVLGEKLDGAFDALGLLIAIGLAVWYGQLPVWYLLVGLLRYLFSWGIWWRERWGKPVYELPPSRNRRVLAGFQMGFISVTLWPLFSPPGTTLVAVLFAVPMFASFGRDWLAVSGRLKPDSPAYKQARRQLLQLTAGWLPPVMRAVVTFVSIQFLFPIAFDEFMRRTLLAWPGALWPNLTADLLGVLAVLTTVMVALGILGRLAALGLLVPTAVTVAATGLNWQNGILVTGAVALMLSGSGNFSLWQPEERLVRVRAGGKRDS